MVRRLREESGDIGQADFTLHIVLLSSLGVPRLQGSGQKDISLEKAEQTHSLLLLLAPTQFLQRFQKQPALSYQVSQNIVDIPIFL